METKVCSKCGETKSLEEFYSKCMCLNCRRKQQRNWYERNAESKRLASRNWRKLNHEKTKMCSRNYAINHPAETIYYNLVASSKKRKMNEICPKEEFVNWLNQQKICYYCGVEESTLSIRLQVDRKDNTKGYIIDNIVLACRECNIAKWDFWSAEVFKKHIGPAIRAAREEVDNLSQHNVV